MAIFFALIHHTLKALMRGEIEDVISVNCLTLRWNATSLNIYK